MKIRAAALRQDDGTLGYKITHVCMEHNHETSDIVSYNNYTQFVYKSLLFSSIKSRKTGEFIKTCLLASMGNNQRPRSYVCQKNLKNG